MTFTKNKRGLLSMLLKWHFLNQLDSAFGALSDRNNAFAFYFDRPLSWYLGDRQ